MGQATAPASVTPPTLRPEQNDNTGIAIPKLDGLQPPAGSENLAITPGTVTIEGGFPELAGVTAPIAAKLQGRRVTLAEVYAAASAIEQAYASAGYVLVRAAVPPQQLVDGGPLRIVVVDGFIEDIDVSGLPARVRAPLLARVARLKGRHHVKLGDIEQPLLIAGAFPGLTLTSTLARGTQEGGARLILSGPQHLVSGSVGGDNQLASSLGTYGVNAQVSINSAFGLGEQIYGLAVNGYDITRMFGSAVPVRVLGGGVVIPLDEGLLTLNPEATFARTQPTVAAGTPRSRGDLRRLTMRSDYVLEKTRRHSVDISLAAEQVDETNTYLGFQPISHDRYMAARAGLSASASGYDGSSVATTLQLSQGLGSLGALQLRDLPVGTTFSRQGAKLGFTKLDAAITARAPVMDGIVFNLVAKAQASFGEALFRAEQGTLEGSDAVSGLVGGITAADSTATLRGEFSRNFAGAGPWATDLAPYVFAAGGLGRLERPTVVELAKIKAASLGAGARFYVPRYGFGITVEYAHSFTDIPGLAQDDRVNFSTSIRF